MAVRQQETRSQQTAQIDAPVRGVRTRSVLDPRGFSSRIGGGMAGHPVSAFVAVTIVGFALLAAAAVVLGWALQTYALPEHGIGRQDERVNVWLADHRTSLRTDISFWLSGMGDVYALPALVAVTTLVAVVLRKWRAAAFIVTAIAVEAATYRVATLTIDRQRPHVGRLDHLPVNDSFYSGHTAASVAVYCGVALLVTSWVRNTPQRVGIWLVAVTLPLLVALARMYRGMHHPTDVAAGLLVGIGCLIVAATAARVAGAAVREGGAS